MKKAGYLLNNEDNKSKNHKKIAPSGGIVVLSAFILGVLYYIAIATYTSKVALNVNTKIIATLTTLLILGLIGFIDDILGLKKERISTGMKFILSIIATIPLIVINVGTPIHNIPFIGLIETGLIYPFVILPLGIAIAATAYDFLKSSHGIETGQSILIIGFLSIVAYFTGSPWLALIGLIAVSSLVALYIYNINPDKVAPGSSLTLSIGALAVIMSVLGDFERFAIIVFIPYLFEALLRIRGGLKNDSSYKQNKDGSLGLKYNKNYSLNHLGISILKKVKPSGKVYGKDIAIFIHGIQIIIFIAIAVALYSY